MNKLGCILRWTQTQQKLRDPESRSHRLSSHEVEQSIWAEYHWSIVFLFVKLCLHNHCTEQLWQEHSPAFVDAYEAPSSKLTLPSPSASAAAWCLAAFSFALSY